jgi:hypothetical protein
MGGGSHAIETRAGVRSVGGTEPGTLVECEVAALLEAVRGR